MAEQNSNKKWLLVSLPLLVTFLLGLLMMKGLNDSKGRDELLSIPLDKPLPEFELAALEGFDEGLKREDFLGQVSLMNIWGSWCLSCLDEHPLFVELGEKTDIPIMGVNWQEAKPVDGPRWLQRHGNPYTKVGADPQSELTILLGITGAPETLVIDQNAHIRWQHAGPVDRNILENELLPLIRLLQEGEE